MKSITTLLLLFVYSIAYPCAIAPKGMHDGPARLVDTSDTIVLAKAVSIEEDGVWLPNTKITFEPIRFLKGAVDGPVHAKGDVLTADDTDAGDFEGHLNPDFWAFPDVGNSFTPGNCQVYGMFRIGETYLLFLRDQGSYKSFENIRSSEDLWLQVVDRIVSDRHPYLEAE